MTQPNITGHATWGLVFAAVQGVQGLVGCFESFWLRVPWRCLQRRQHMGLGGRGSFRLGVKGLNPQPLTVVATRVSQHGYCTCSAIVVQLVLLIVAVSTLHQVQPSAKLPKLHAGRSRQDH